MLQKHVTLQFLHLRTQKSFNLVKKWKKCWKVFNKYMLMDSFTLLPTLRIRFWFSHRTDLILKRKFKQSNWFSITWSFITKCDTGLRIKGPSENHPTLVCIDGFWW
jgi:hypothetical protein